MLARKTRSMPNRAVSASLAAPTKGWNARDALGDMDPLYAVILENWFPSTSDVAMRFGYSDHVTGITGQVESVMSYNGLTTDRLLAAAGTAIYNVTSAGAVGAAILSGMTNARWQYINYANLSGAYIYIVNGADSPRYWDGSSWTVAAIVGSGLTNANLIHINAHKNRIWFVEDETLNAWYLATSAIAGAATKFDLTGVATMGGYLMAMATWTIDAGYGVDDLAVFLTSEGEAIVYRGTDPASSSTWGLVGVWILGAPIGRRCFMKYGGDLLVISRDGIQPLAAALQSSRTNPKVALTDAIQQATTASVTLYGSNYGWEIAHYPSQNMLLLNVPVQEGDVQEQYVMNTITKAWCKFSGWDANCWALFNESLYFGGNGFVGLAWDGLDDNGSAINADGLQAFNYFNSPAKLKRFTMMRPILQTNGTPSTLAALNIDFDTSDPTSPLAFTPTSYGVWDVGLWDTAIWGSDVVISKSWQGANGIGYCAAPRLKVSASGIQVRWVSTDIVAEPGAIL
jgi:hypothetical protein